MSLFDSAVQRVSYLRSQQEAANPNLFATISDQAISNQAELDALLAGKTLVQWVVKTTSGKVVPWAELNNPGFSYMYGTPVDATYRANFVQGVMNAPGWGKPAQDALRAFMATYPNATPDQITAAAVKANALAIAPTNTFNQLGQNVAMLAAAAGFAYVAYAGLTSTAAATQAPVSVMPSSSAATSGANATLGSVTASTPAPVTGFSALGSSPIDLSASGVGAGSGMTAASVPSSIGAATNAAIGTNMVAGATATDTLAATIGTAQLPGAVYAGSTIPGVTIDAAGTWYDSLGNIINPSNLPPDVAAAAKSAALGFLAPSPAPKATTATRQAAGSSLPTLALAALAVFAVIKFA